MCAFVTLPPPMKMPRMATLRVKRADYGGRHRLNWGHLRCACGDPHHQRRIGGGNICGIRTGIRQQPRCATSAASRGMCGQRGILRKALSGHWSPLTRVQPARPGQVRTARILRSESAILECDAVERGTTAGMAKHRRCGKNTRDLGVNFWACKKHDTRTGASVCKKLAPRLFLGRAWAHSAQARARFTKFLPRSTNLDQARPPGRVWPIWGEPCPNAA